MKFHYNDMGHIFVVLLAKIIVIFVLLESVVALFEIIAELWEHRNIDQRGCLSSQMIREVANKTKVQPDYLNHRASAHKYSDGGWTTEWVVAFR